MAGFNVFKILRSHTRIDWIVLKNADHEMRNPDEVRGPIFIQSVLGSIAREPRGQTTTTYVRITVTELLRRGPTSL